MKHLIAVSVWILFMIQPSPIAPAQTIRPSTLQSVKDNTVLKATLDKQEAQIDQKKDSLSNISNAILSGEIKPKVIVKWRYRTKIKTVHDTVYLERPIDISDYADDPLPCPDSISIIPIPCPPVEKKKGSFLKRLFL